MLNQRSGSTARYRRRYALREKWASPHRRWLRWLNRLLLLCFVLLSSRPLLAQPAREPAAQTTPCFNAWSVPGIRLKDHTLFKYQDYYYLLSIRFDTTVPGAKEDSFAYGRTRDFCTWEDLGIALEHGEPRAADETYVWAPHVIEDNGTYYMFYTGVNQNISQSIMLATTTDPSNPASWTKQGVVFRPNHPNVIYPGPEQWSDARDAMVMHYGDRYYMYYTGADTTGGIVGVAMAKTLAGPWRDLGATLRMTLLDSPESPFVVAHDGYFYLYINASGQHRTGEEWLWGPSPFGPWQPPVPAQIGWANDFYDTGAGWYTTYMVGTGEAIQVLPLLWDTSTDPASPYYVYKSSVTKTYLPFVATEPVDPDSTGYPAP